MRNFLIFTALVLSLGMSAAFAQPPPGPPPPPPPHEMEPPEGVPPSLLELKSELDSVDGKYGAAKERLEQAIQASPGGFRGGFGGPLKRHEIALQMGKNHEIIRQMGDLRHERDRIVGDAWRIFHDTVEPPKESAQPPVPPQKREELERWMMFAFGPPPREHGPFPGKGEGWGEHRWMFRGELGQKLLERLDRMEKRIGVLEAQVERQQKEIEALKKATGGANPQGDAER